jgi:hypothetical protein
MKLKTMNYVIGLALLTALTLSGMSSTRTALGAPKRAESNGPNLEGTWRVQVTIRDCHSGVSLRTFPAFLTFAQGGTLTETTTGFVPTLRSPGHGFWRHTTDQSYLAVSEAFLFSPAGVWSGTQRLTQSIEIGNSPDQLNSTATNEIYDTTGQLITSGCATAVATRTE